MQYTQPTSLDAIRVEFMDVAYEIHKQESETTKKTKARKRFEARKAIEEHQENKQLQNALKEWWDEI